MKHLSRDPKSLVQYDLERALQYDIPAEARDYVQRLVEDLKGNSDFSPAYLSRNAKKLAEVIYFLPFNHNLHRFQTESEKKVLNFLDCAQASLQIWAVEEREAIDGGSPLPSLRSQPHPGSEESSHR